MQSMSDDDAAYSALLAQLLNDSATSRNARVHSWIEHQYDFVLSEQSPFPFPSSRPPSPSPSSSLGAHRTCFIDRPDSPLLPRPSSERPSSPCPSYDALFFPPSKSDDFEEQERVRALRFIVQEMALWKSQAPPPSPLSSDKPLPAPPPSPASSLTQSICSRVMRSRSSSTRISRLPSFTSTLSSDHSHPQEIAPPLPVSVIVHGEYQHDLVLSRSPIVDSYLYNMPDDKCPVHPSPTLSTFSSESRDAFSDPSLPPTANVFPASPTSSYFPEAIPAAHYRLGAPKPLEHSQSRWSLATTASLAPSTASRPSAFLNPTTPPQKDKGLKTQRKRTRFISLISRLSPGRSDPFPPSGGDVDYDSANDSDTEDRDKFKPRKSLSKKSSLASIRASFSISRPSFSSQRPPVSSPVEEVPPLPTSPTRSSPMTDIGQPLEAPPSISRPSLSKIPSRANLVNTPLPPIPQSASTITPFKSSSQISISDISVASRASRNVAASASRIALLPAPGKRTSLASAAGIEPMVSTKPVPVRQATVRSKSIFRLTAKPKSVKAPALPETKTIAFPGNTVRSRIPQAPAKFTPPAKLATVIATQSRQLPVPIGPAPTSTSKLPTPPTRMLPPKVPRSVTSPEKPPAESFIHSRLPMPAAKGSRVGTVKGFWKRQ